MSFAETLEATPPITPAETYPEPEPIEGLSGDGLPSLEPDSLPSLLAEWAQAKAEAMNAPFEYLATAALTACAGAVGNKVLVKPDPEANPSHALALNVWALQVGEPGVKKSPTLSAAFAPLDDLEAELSTNWQAGTKAYEAALEIWKEKKEGPKPEKPKEAALLAHEITAAALGVLLEANPYGLVSKQDEVMGLLKAWDRPDKAGERQFYLSLWNGTDAYTVRTIKRGSQYLPITTLTLAGNTQPDLLRGYVLDALKGKNSGNDGLLVRFQLFVNAKAKLYERKVPTPERKAQLEALDRQYVHLVHRLYTLGAELPTLPLHKVRANVERPYLRFDEQAQGLFTEWQYKNSLEINNPNTPSVKQGMLAKHDSLLPKLAALCQLIEAPGPFIGVRAYYQAAYLVEFYKAHTLAAWGQVLRPEVSGLQVLAKALLERKRTKTFNFERFTPRDILRSNWRGLSDKKTIAEVLEEAVAANWVIQDQGGYRPNPRIWEVQP